MKIFFWTLALILAAASCRLCTAQRGRETSSIVPALSVLFIALTLAGTLAVAADAAGGAPSRAAAGEPLAGTEPLRLDGDLAARMVADIDAYLMRATEAAARERPSFWKRDLSSPEAYSRSVAPNRERLRKILGLQDRRVPFQDLELIATRTVSAEIGGTPAYRVLSVRWPVFEGVYGEGLLLDPHQPAHANVVALPDCDWTPEMLAGLAPGVPAEAQFARRLAENGCRVVIPTLIDRKDTYSGRPDTRYTNQPHREFIYRAAFEMGRSLVGFEVQKVLAVVDWFASLSRSGRAVPTGVMGYGEGGLLALYSAAVDERIGAAVVSGYFQPRERLWSEPIYRNLWGLLAEFGDAELASLVAPRALIIETASHPEITGPPPVRDGRSGAAPGVITTPKPEAVEAEVERARALTAGLEPAPLLRRTGTGSGNPGADETVLALLRALGHQGRLHRNVSLPSDLRKEPDTEGRQKRQFEQLVEHTQRLMREGEFTRAAFWSKADPTTPERWRESTRQYRNHLWDEVIGRLPAANVPAKPRTRLIYDEPAYRGYEVVLDVWEGVYAYGILLLPKDLKPGERRPVVVCQHGLEGRPQDVADAKVDNPAYHMYAARLAERGFITFSPQNPYIGQDRFRVLQRKANPLKRSLFSFIVRQHERILEWLAAQPFVDPDRMAFYGLSYGGKTAMRVPALLERYCLSICSADYNEWIWKNVSSRHRYSYLFTGEYEMVEFDLGNTFNYAEMSWLICPRPFMVERGHDDGVAPDEWVAYEFAKTRQRFDRLGLGDRVELEVFLGPHTIHGVGTFNFLARHLNWPRGAVK